jgi:hypothetical protein
LDARIAVPQHVMHRAFPTETVLLNLNTGQYHGLNPTAGRMFEVLEETRSPRQAAAQLAAEFELQIGSVEADLNELCAGLVDRGLLEVVER